MPKEWTYDQVVLLCEIDGVPLPEEFVEWMAEKLTMAANRALDGDAPSVADAAHWRERCEKAENMIRELEAVIAKDRRSSSVADAAGASCQNCGGTGSHGGRFHTDGKGNSEYEPYKCDVCDGFGTIAKESGNG